MSELSITLLGFPEKVQRVADAIESLFPGQVAWIQASGAGKGNTIKIEGMGVPLIMPARPSKSRG